MIEIIQLKNQLAGSNCFILENEVTKSCIIIDPASELAEREISYIKVNRLRLDYVILTHAHADHSWGVNKLKTQYPDMKLVYHEDKFAQRDIMLYFKLYHEDPNYIYELVPADIYLVDGQIIDWNGHQIKFIDTPGHSVGSVCFTIDGVLFTGDTIMPYPPFFNGRGCNKGVWAESVKMIMEKFDSKTKIYPGHGEVVTLEEWAANDEWSKTK